jgi:hypothetical protein
MNFPAHHLSEIRNYAAAFIDLAETRIKTLDILSELQGEFEFKNFPVFSKAANEKGMYVMLWTKFRDKKRE